MYNSPKSKIVSNVICGGVFTVMLLFLLIQFHNVMVYFDDYGYYSLSYGMNTSAGGHTFSFSELISFLKSHYYEVNGRIPGYFVWLSLYMIGELTLVQVSAALIVTGILILLWKFIDQKKHPITSSVLVCAFYGLIPLSMHKQGTYWFAAFFQYVAPVAAIVLFAILYFKYRSEKFDLKKHILLVIVVFASAYSQEQLSVTVTFMMCLLLAYEGINKNIRGYHFIYLLTATLCVAALLMSPSSQQRAASSGYGILETIIYSTYHTIHTFFSADIRILVLLLYLAVFNFSFHLYLSDRHVFKLIDLGGMAFACLSIIIYMCDPLLNLFAKYTFHRYYALITLGVPCVALIAIQIMRYYWTNSQFARLLLFMTAVGSVGCLCFVPETPERLFISSWLLLFPTLADGIFAIDNRIIKKKVKHAYIILPVITIVIVLFSVQNLFTIYHGYAANAEAYRYNDAQFNAAAERERNGMAIDSIYLKTMPSPECAAALVYHKEVTYMKHWMKIYYGIDSDPMLYYNDLGTPSDLLTYKDQGNNVFLN